MAASANPSGNQDGSSGPSSFQSGGGGGGGAAGNPSNDNAAVAVPDNSGPAQALKHDPGLSKEWSPEEQSILEEGIAKYASESSLVRYAKIAMQLQDKTVRDVALRCRWMNKKGCGKKRKDDHNQSRKINKKGGSDPSAKTPSQLARPGGSPYPLPVLPVDNDDDISYKAIGGATGQLLEQNSQVFNQISANLANYQIQENINLFCQTRDNILSILNDSLKDMPEIMKQMPPLPVKVNEELANSILPRASVPMQS